MLDVTLAEALKRYAREVDPKFASIVEKYLMATGSKGTDSATFQRYLKKMKTQGYQKGTVDLHYRTIRAFYRRFNILPPQFTGWNYNLKEGDRPALGADTIEHMVEIAKSGELSDTQIHVLMLSTIYGMRASELLEVEVEVALERLFIRTKKGGRQRFCYLPPTLKPYLSFARIGDINAAFRGIWDATMDYKRPRGMGWHSIRRSLVRDLSEKGVSDADVTRFMRWSSSALLGTSRMKELYADPSQSAGIGGMEAVNEEEESKRRYDQSVWEHHPYLHLWE